MCYFGPPPYAVIDMDTKEYSEYNRIDNLESSGVGFYYNLGTGCYYSFFDGEKHWRDRIDWGKPSEKYWSDTNGVYPIYNKYIFLYDKNHWGLNYLQFSLYSG